MTNVLDLSRNFCYNNNREVKARMTRRTREAMASELQLPQHYVELDQQEMTYVDGGGYVDYASVKSVSGLYYANFVIWTSDAVLCGVLAGLAWWNPLGWGAAAIAVIATIIAATMYGNYCSATAALATADLYTRQGKSYKIWESTNGLTATYIVA